MLDEQLLERIRENDPTLTTIDLGGSYIGDEGAKALTEALKVNQSLTEIDLRNNDIGAEGAKALAKALKINESLTKIDLSDNNIGSEGAKALAKALKINESLTKIDLYSNNIGSEGAKALAEALKVNQSLSTIDLFGNNIGDEGATALAEALNINQSLTILNLRRNNIGSAGAAALAEALKENQSLTTVYLGGNNIGDEGATALAEALKENQSLTAIDLAFNNIGSAGAKALAEALKVNQSLTTINLFGNDIGDEYQSTINDALHVNQALAIFNELAKEPQEKMLLEEGLFKQVLLPIKQTSPPLRTRLATSILAFAKLCKKQNLRITSVVGAEPLIKVLFDYRDTKIVGIMSEVLVNNLQDETYLSKLPGFVEAQEALNTGRKLSGQKSLALLKHAMLVPLLNDPQVLNQKGFILNHKVFRDSKKLTPVMQCLAHLNRNKRLTLEEKQNLLNVILDDATPRGSESPRAATGRILKYMRILSSLLALEKTEAIKSVKSVDDLSIVLKQGFEAIIGKLPDDIDMSEAFNDTFGQFRQPLAVIRYASTLNKLQGHDKELCLKALNTFVTEVLSGDFQAKRYASQKEGDNLDFIFKALGEEGRAEWIKGEKLDLSEIESKKDLEHTASQAEQPDLNYKDIFTQKIVIDKHLSHKDFPLLIDFFKAESEKEIKVAQGVIKKELDSLTVSRKSDKPRTEKEEIHLKRLQCTNLIAKLAQEKHPTPQAVKSNLLKIDALLGKLDPNIELRNDLKMLMQDKQPGQYKNYTIEDADHPNDLLLLGTEVDGSCQRVDGSPNTNKGLLGYLLDGTVRAIVIKSPGGEIVARTLLRQLYDETTNQVVLFQERIYPANTSPALKDALIKMATRRAAALNVPLVGSGSENNESLYPNALKSYGSRAPYMYADACGGQDGAMKPRGEFTIAGNRFPLIHTPKLGLGTAPVMSA